MWCVFVYMCESVRKTLEFIVNHAARMLVDKYCRHSNRNINLAETALTLSGPSNALIYIYVGIWLCA